MNSQFNDIEDVEKFLHYAKVANPTYNHSELLLTLIKEIKFIRSMMLNIQNEIDEIKGIED
jgi:hypothetical protein